MPLGVMTVLGYTFIVNIQGNPRRFFLITIDSLIRVEYN